MKKLERIACPLTLGFQNSAPSSTSMDYCDRVHDLPKPLLFCVAGFLSFWMPHAFQSNSSYSTFTAPMYTGLEVSRALFQQQFSIPKARRVLRQLIRRCINCRKKDSLPRSTFHSVQLEMIIRDHFSSKPRVQKNDISFSSLASSPELSILKVQRN